MDHDQPAVDRAWERLLADPSPLDTQYLAYAKEVVDWQAEKFDHDFMEASDGSAMHAVNATTALIDYLAVRLARALALLANHPLPTVRVTFSPCSTLGASYGDTMTNELTAHPANNITEVPTEELYQYLGWWTSTVSGTVTSVDDRDMTVDIRLDHPAPGGYLFCRYPYDTAGTDLISIVADEFRRATTKGGCYDYQNGCRCPSCLEFEETEA